MARRWAIAPIHRPRATIRSIPTAPAALRLAAAGRALEGAVAVEAAEAVAVAVCLEAVAAVDLAAGAVVDLAVAVAVEIAAVVDLGAAVADFRDAARRRRSI